MRIRSEENLHMLHHLYFWAWRYVMGGWDGMVNRYIKEWSLGLSCLI